MRREGSSSSSSKTTAFPLVVPLLVGATALGETNDKEENNYEKKGRRNCYYGFLSVLGRDYRLCVEEPEEESAEGIIGHQHGTLSNAQVSCEPALQLLLSPHLSVIKERLKQSADVETFLVELKDILERVVREETNEERAVDPSFYGRVVAELDAIGWHHLLWVDDTMTCLKLQQSDEEGRTHIITLRLSSDHPQSAPLCMTDLPQPLVLRWHHKTSNLSHVLVQFKQALENYQPLWRVMDDFDDNTWVLEPDPGHASYSSTMRRIVTGNHCSLQLNLDPSHPFAVPECRLLGPDAIVGPLQQKLNSNLHHWFVLHLFFFLLSFLNQSFHKG
ncbi:FA complementation group L, variant 3 [Balamuthia mandrillaris]